MNREDHQPSYAHSKSSPGKDIDNQLRQAEARLFETEAAHKYLLSRFGDTIAKREGYTNSNLTGLTAVHFYICHKFHWRPAVVQSMSADELKFLLQEEMNDWHAPKGTDAVLRGK